MENPVWYQRVCERMVREGNTLFYLVCEMNLGLTKGECLELERTKEFASVLRTERWRFYKELASDPNRSKTSAIGSLLFMADRLADQGNFDKAANVIMNVAKMEGWLDEKTQINVFGDLTQKDIAAMRAKVQKAMPAQA